MPLISDHPRFMASVDIEDFNSWDIKKCQFQFLVTFLPVFFWYVNCTNQVCISSHILNVGSVLFEGF